MKIKAAQPPIVGWLDYSDEDLKKARELLREFGKDQTLDELGIGPIRDALADLFFPATNTIMTRTRYLFFVSAAYLALERERTPGRLAAKRLRALEDGGIRNALSDTETTGVIGREKKEKLKRYPSNIYWNALKQLRFFRHPTWLQSYYHSDLDDFYKANTVSKDDDGLVHQLGMPRRNWDANLEEVLLQDGSILTTNPTHRRGYELVPTLDFNLTKAEATYLKEQFRGMDQATDAGHPTGQSLLSFLVDEKFQGDFDYPWETPSPPQLSQSVGHARFFSIFVKGITLQYYCLLVQAMRKRKMKHAPEWDMADVFAYWWNTSVAELATWPLEEFFVLAARIGSTRDGDKEFIRTWWQLCINSPSAAALLNNSEAQKCIKERELYKRPRKARLHRDELLSVWRPPDSPENLGFGNAESIPFWLDYRSTIGRTFVHDIVKGLKRKT